MGRLAGLLVAAVFVLVSGGVALSDEPATAMRSVVSVLPQWPGRPPNADEPEGSGEVVGEGRPVITANHVLGAARRVLVRTSAGEVIAARIAGGDKASDLALLEIDDALPAFVFARPPNLGAPVCAIGNACGLGLSLTCGTVSAVQRSNAGFNAIEDFVQTDAAVNPGASGGALVNEKGELVGVLSAIFTKTSDANIGVNFAVSAALVERVYGALKTGRRIVWRFAGLGLRNAPARGATGRQGALVVSVQAGGAGARAGLQAGDLIVQAGGRRVRGAGGFRAAMALLMPGEHMQIVFRRDEKDMTAELINDGEG